MSKTGEAKLREAINILSIELKNNPDYREVWSSSLAMCVIDEYDNTPDVFKKDIHTIANNASKNFLDLLIKSE